MISLETKAEENWAYDLMKVSNIKDVHTSGRYAQLHIINLF